MSAATRPLNNPPLERTAAAVYFSCGRSSRVRRRGRSAALRYAAEAPPMSALSNSEIDAIERELGMTLPGLYHRLLFEIGPGKFGDVQIYHPNEVRELYEPFFDDPRQLFSPYFPFGCHNRKQELWVIDAASETAASIWH